MSELQNTRLKFHWNNLLEIWEKILYRFRLYKSVLRLRFYEAKQMVGQCMLESKQVFCDLQTSELKVLTKIHCHKIHAKNFPDIYAHAQN